MEVIQHFSIQASRRVFHHKKYGFVCQWDGMRIDDAKAFGFDLVYVYGVRLEAFGDPFLQLCLRSDPIDPLYFLQQAWEIWRKEPHLSGRPDLLKLHEQIAENFPRHMRALSELGVNWLIGQGTDKKFAGGIRSCDKLAGENMHLGYGDDKTEMQSLDVINRRLIDRHEYCFDTRKFKDAIAALNMDRRSSGLDVSDIDLAHMRHGIKPQPLKEEAFLIGGNTPPPRSHVNLEFNAEYKKWQFFDPDNFDGNEFERIDRNGKLTFYSHQGFGDDDELDIEEADDDDLNEEDLDEDRIARKNSGKKVMRQAFFPSSAPHFNSIARDIIKPVVLNYPIAQSTIAKSIGISVRELKSFLSDRQDLEESDVWSLAHTLGLYWHDSWDEFLPDRPMVLIARQKSSIIDAYDRLSHGGDIELSNEVLPADPSSLGYAYRIMLFRPNGFYHGCHVILFDKSEKKLDLLSEGRESFLNLDPPKNISNEFYADLVVYCQRAMSADYMEDSDPWKQDGEKAAILSFWKKHDDEIEKIIGEPMSHYR